MIFCIEKKKTKFDLKVQPFYQFNIIVCYFDKIECIFYNVFVRAYWTPIQNIKIYFGAETLSEFCTIARESVYYNV